MFHKTMKEQMSVNSRVKDECLIVRLSFGCAKSRFEIVSMDEAHDYTDEHAMIFSQTDDELASPFIRKMGVVNRDDTWK